MPLTIGDVTRHIRSHIDGGLSDNGPSLGEIAAHFGVNRFWLSRWFPAQTGLSLREYVAALRIEKGIGPLVEQKNIIMAQLEAGHASAATFSHRFRAHTGIAPRDYRAQAAVARELLDAELGDPHPRALLHSEPYPKACCQPHALQVEVEGASPGVVVFAGLFAQPIPRGRPVVGRALFRTRSFVIDAVPDGVWHLLGCEIRPSRNPLDYFRLDHCLRGMADEPVVFPLPAPRKVALRLRPFQPDDPPITVNLPQLLLEALRGRNP
ncbi:MAG: helix-turn-helix transcriptional regulator [Lautropia sp.]|nr:helix-turn-helix transcriptional regulator [Lautropia sp.]